jgi:anti-sigma factor RsiW
MTEEQQLKIQSFLDGELPEAEAREMASWIARDADAKAMHAELKNTRKAIKASEVNVQLPESREFFWSKIQRDIERLEPARESKPHFSIFDSLRRLLVPVSALAVVVISGFMAYNQLSPEHPTEAEMAMADSSAFTYHDYSAGTTLVWLPFPAENDLEQDSAPTTIQ